ncbi:MAG: DNA primase [Candidatus Latescibacteria bacterium]|nr:DNA primase [Candidatus Latescibacterota bacterium]NIM22169.1 DNA primase [Candidatus Latescibacterota bacterium]NIM64719.1 DNA primase [Candidatus Latescibacterota bacterium]NIO01229.1 DNA primase [Candidatus Latescibacterota bacterium]NIO27614.1 DNA primase [Candidatus Latescibacterota bacterium]
MPIPQETIESIRDRADIVEVVSRYLELRRSGRNFRALCPFHEEKTPSFFVSPERQTFHCFGCGTGGNVFSFVMEMEGISFPEAVRSLGRQYGVEVVTRAIPESERTKNEALYEANAFAATWYRRALLDRKTGEGSRKYLLERGITEASWEAFSVGYAPEGWDALFRACRKQGLSIEMLREAGLIATREGKTGYYDYFRNRLIFPIFSLSGRVIAFGARGLDPRTEPKYLNSPESPIFAKRQTLYGLNLAREAIREQRQVLIVEGYTDCISLHQIGLRHTVASCGTAITPLHAQALRRVTRQAVLIPDGDEAGENAALSAGIILLAAGLDVQVIRLEPGSDPDAAARRLGAEKFQKLIAGGMAYFEYFSYIMKDRVFSPLDREAIVKRMLAGLEPQGDRLRREMIIQELARVLSVDADSLRAQVSRTWSRVPSGEDRRNSSGEDRRVKREKLVLRLMQENHPEVDTAKDMLDTEDFSQESCREYYKLLDFAWEKNIDLKSIDFQRKAEEAGLEAVAAEIALITIPPGNFARLLKDTIKRIKELKIRDELDVLQEKLKKLPADSEDALAVVEYRRKLKQALSEL